MPVLSGNPKQNNKVSGEIEGFELLQIHRGFATSTIDLPFCCFNELEYNQSMQVMKMKHQLRFLYGALQVKMPILQTISMEVK